MIDDAKLVLGPLQAVQSDRAWPRALPLRVQAYGAFKKTSQPRPAAAGGNGCFVFVGQGLPTARGGRMFTDGLIDIIFNADGACGCIDATTV